MGHQLPVLNYDGVGSLAHDGRRRFVYPADVSGRFTRLRRIGFVVLIVVLLALPFIQVGGHPAVFLDIPARRFFLFGETFNAQDFWLVFFGLTGVGFALIATAAVYGRVWCGYACPQTVFLEGLYRRIERLIDGPHSKWARRQRGPWTASRLGRFALKHLIFAALSVFLAHVFLSYFTSLPGLWLMVTSSPAEHPTAFTWIVVMAVALYVNFAWFREQLCVIICPYGRLQSSLSDDDTIVVGYDESRGEPRGKKRDPNAGDCVDCKRCVQVCPTGIDIRDGLQLDCIGCAACVDACDEVMTKIGRDVGLVRYDSLRGLRGETRRFFRPRLILYAVLGLVGLVVASFAVRSREPFEAVVRRQGAAPFIVQGETVVNAAVVHIVNKQDEEVVFTLRVEGPDAAEISLGAPELTLAPFASDHTPVVVRFQRGAVVRDTLWLDIRGADGEHERVSMPIVGPAAVP